MENTDKERDEQLLADVQFIQSCRNICEANRQILPQIASNLQKYLGANLKDLIEIRCFQATQVGTEKKLDVITNLSKTGTKREQANMILQKYRLRQEQVKGPYQSDFYLELMG